MSDDSDSTDLDDAPSGSAVVTKRRHLLVGRPRTVIVVGALVTTLIVVGLWQGFSSSPTNSTALSGPAGAPAPAFSLRSLANSTGLVSPATFRGRPLVMNFWASWCVPCRTEMPLLEAAFRSEKGRVAFLGIDSNDTSSAARAFLAKVLITYPVVSDPSGGVAIRYGLFGLPTTFFISSTGKIIGRHIGQLRANTLRAALHQAFGE
ncbi:MAG: TlpA family protein disulfide reductase [Hyphomicrobiales bacterium]